MAVSSKSRDAGRGGPSIPRSSPVFIHWCSVGCGPHWQRGPVAKSFHSQIPKPSHVAPPFHLSLSFFGYLNNQDPTLKMEALCQPESLNDWAVQSSHPTCQLDLKRKRVKALRCLGLSVIAASTVSTQTLGCCLNLLKRGQLQTLF